MKIDFRGTYDSLSNVVNHRPRPIAKESDFGRLLGDVYSDRSLHIPMPTEQVVVEEVRPKLQTKNTVPSSLNEPDPTPVTIGLNKKITEELKTHIEELKSETSKSVEQIKHAVAESVSKLQVDIAHGLSSLQRTEKIPVAEKAMTPSFKPLDEISTRQTKQLFDPRTDSLNFSKTPEQLLTPVPPQAFQAVASFVPKKDSPIRDSIFNAVMSAGRKFGVDPALGMAVARQESGLNHKAVSADGHGSKGVFQLLDKTGKDLMARQGLDPQVYDPFNPELNVNLGMGYLRYLHDIFSTPVELTKSRSTHKAGTQESLEKFAIAAFNAGEGRVASAQARALAAGKDPSLFNDVVSYLPKTTQHYVSQVLNHRDEYAGEQEREDNFG